MEILASLLSIWWWYEYRYHETPNTYAIIVRLVYGCYNSQVVYASLLWHCAITPCTTPCLNNWSPCSSKLYGRNIFKLSSSNSFLILFPGFGNFGGLGRWPQIRRRDWALLMYTQLGQGGGVGLYLVCSCMLSLWAGRGGGRQSLPVVIYYTIVGRLS